MQSKKAGVLLTAVSDARVYPRDARLYVPEHIRVIRPVEDLLPDTADRFAQQRRLGVKVIINRSHGHAAGQTRGRGCLWCIVTFLSKNKKCVRPNISEPTHFY